MAVARYPVGRFVQAWDPADDDPALGQEQAQWAAVRRAVDRAQPRRIGVDVSATFAHADGLSHTDATALLAALGPWADRVVHAEQLVVRWLETRLPAEIDALHAMNALSHATIATAFSPAVVTVGQTTALDVAWWVRQRFHDLGVEPWFQPTVGLQRAGVPLGGVPEDAVVEPGDLLHCDVGLKTLGLTTDTQRNAYVLRPGETAPRPAWCTPSPSATGCRTWSPRRCCPVAPGTRCWPPLAPPRPPRAWTATSTATRSASTATARARRSACGTRRAACRAPVRHRSAPTPPGRWSCACGCRCRSGAGRWSGWPWSRASR
ncbi:M24 family metallopeptidase [Klenkia terrae]|uniref:M24 family metallopeptidase n=1 Tax=Klenkia terrae TaxID=1052259 RepID=UPI00360FF767